MAIFPGVAGSFFSPQYILPTIRAILQLTMLTYGQNFCETKRLLGQLEGKHKGTVEWWQKEQLLRQKQGSKQLGYRTPWAQDNLEEGIWYRQYKRKQE